MTNPDKLINAIKLRDIDQIKAILDEDGELVNARDKTGATALHYAAFDGLHEIVLLLLDRTIGLGDARWVARFLERFPALRQGKDINGKPFRQLAAESGNREVMALFRLPGETGS
jgi:ankyrin repeat protein